MPTDGFLTAWLRTRTSIKVGTSVVRMSGKSSVIGLRMGTALYTASPSLKRSFFSWSGCMKLNVTVSLRPLLLRMDEIFSPTSWWKPASPLEMGAAGRVDGMFS